MKIGAALEAVAEAEAELAHALAGIGERHRADHDVFHTTRTLANRERAHIDELGAHAKRYGTSVERAQQRDPESAGPLQKVAANCAELVGRRPEPAMLLLSDLRRVYLLASEASINWVMLGQGAQAIKDAELLAVVTKGHGETLQTVKWAIYRIKSAAPQILAT